MSLSTTCSSCGDQPEMELESLEVVSAVYFPLAAELVSVARAGGASSWVPAQTADPATPSPPATNAPTTTEAPISPRRVRVGIGGGGGGGGPCVVASVEVMVPLSPASTDRARIARLTVTETSLWQ